MQIRTALTSGAENKTIKIDFLGEFVIDYWKGDLVGGELPEFLRVLKDRDPEYAENILENYEKRFFDEALSAKTKTLIALALDAGNGDVGGAESLTRRAKELGATEDELLEIIEVVEGTCSFQGLAVAMKAL